MIDKIIPRFLSTSEDERLQPEGAMVEARNVTISEDGDGTANVLKNAKGTLPGYAAEAVDAITDKVVVIGSVSDDANSKIYFFVAADSTATDSTTRSRDAIYQYDTTTNQYRIVVKSPYLNFRPSYFVKADVINGAFGESSSNQTILYFTDNNNPPRKVNVDRAISDGVYSGDEDDFNRVISVIKSASNTAPKFRFTSDSSRDASNMKGAIFQFATQIIYTDGEESAVSPYSQIAVARPTFLSGMGEDGYGATETTDNVIVISHNIDLNIPDIASIRIIGRSSNEANFFVIDEFDPTQDRVRNVDGTETTVFSANSNDYTFYNDVLGYLIDPTTIAKTYDNVPLKAKGQAVVGNRLFYSNYVEGFENVDVSAIPLSVAFSDQTGSGSSNIPSGQASSMFTNVSPINIKVDMVGGTAFDVLESGGTADAETVVPAGTLTTMSFDYTPRFTIARGATGLVHFKVIAVGDNPWDPFDPFIESPAVYKFDSLDLDTPISGDTGTKKISFSHSTTSDETIADVSNAMRDQLGQYTMVVNYNIDGDTAEFVSGYNIGDLEIGSGLEAIAKVTIKFCTIASDETGITDALFTISPYIYDIEIKNNGGGQVFVDEGTSELQVTPDNPSGFFGCQDDGITYTAIGSQFSNPAAESTSVSIQQTFKAGATHSFGMVFYDEHNRSGFVNEIGSVYVPYPSERTSGQGKGAASISFEFWNRTASQPHIPPPPSWAKKWQIVYAGKNTFDGIFQYGTGNAYVGYKKEGGEQVYNSIDTTNKRIYVSLKSLDLFREERNTLRDYSFTKGDKLRIIKSRNSADSGWDYPTASDGSVIEFDVVDTVILGGADNPIHDADAVTTGSHAGHDHSVYKGTFLVLEAPAIAAGVVGSDGSQLKYVGYDWNHVARSQNGSPDSAFNYYDVSEPSDLNYWKRKTIVDIVTPKKYTENRVYYEIGVGGDVAQTSSDPGYLGTRFVTTSQGDVHFRPVMVKGPNYAPGFVGNSTTNWDYELTYLEDSNVIETATSNSWSKGRPHTVYNKAKEVRRTNSATYSDAYDQDIETLTLSSFNPTLANFANWDIKYGDLNYIDNYDNMLLGLQENKVSYVPVSKSIINQSAGGDPILGLNTNVLSQESISYLSGDYGCGNHPESVLIYDTQVFFVDRSRSAVVRFTREGLSPITEKGVSSLVNAKFERFEASTKPIKKVVSGYDPDDNYYYFSLVARGAGDNKQWLEDPLIASPWAFTLAYDVRRGVWQSEYTFAPDGYARQNNTMYSFSYFPPGGNIKQIIHRHVSDAPRNTFQGYSPVRYASKISVISKYNPDLVKAYNAISLNGDNKWTAIVEDSEGRTTKEFQSFVEKEGVFYSNIPISGGAVGSYDSASVRAIGVCSSESSGVLTIDQSLRRAHISTGMQIGYLAGSTIVPSGIVGSVSGNTITVLGGAPSSFVGNQVLIINSFYDGEKIRGTYAKVTLENYQSTTTELYGINLHYSNSKLNHALGQ